MDELTFASKVGSAIGDSEESSGLPSADPGDVAQFQQWLQPATPGSAGDPGSHGLGAFLSAASEATQEQQQKFNATLKRVAQTADPVQALSASRQLGDLYLTHALAVKVIGKTTQAIDTLSRLQ